MRSLFARRSSRRTPLGWGVLPKGGPAHARRGEGLVIRETAGEPERHQKLWPCFWLCTSNRCFEWVVSRCFTHVNLMSIIPNLERMHMDKANRQWGFASVRKRLHLGWGSLTAAQETVACLVTGYRWWLVRGSCYWYLFFFFKGLKGLRDMFRIQ